MEATLNIPAPELRASILVFLFKISKPIYRFSFKHFTRPWATTRAELARFKENSLGRHLFIFLNSHGFEVESKLESHDVGHVLLGYDTDVVSEIGMQFFYLGSGKKSVYSLLTTLLGYLIVPEYYKTFHQAFQRGKTALNFQHWNFEHLLGENINTLRAQIFNQQEENNLYI